MHPVGVIFDMDGVLVDSRDAHLQSWRALAAEIGAAGVTEAHFDASFGQRSDEIIQNLFAIHDPQRIVRCSERKEAIYRDIIRRAVPAMPGARELVTALHEAGMRLAVGSSGPRENVELVCEALGVRARFSVLITGADVSAGKPDPQVFLLCARRLGLPPTFCIVLEDAPLGVEAARRAGMPCVALVGSHPRAALAAADLVVDRLGDLDVAAIRRLVAPASATQPGDGRRE
jgi:beta-phosphoglucomutase